MATTKTGTGLREVVHQRVRLGVLAVLARRDRATFTELRDALGQSDGALSRHLGVLEQHGLVVTEKVFENRRPRTWVTMTDAGTEAFRDEQEQLAALLRTADSETRSDGDGIAVAVVFAALLDGDGERDRADEDEGARADVDRSALVPALSDLAGRDVDLLAAGPIDDRYGFPPTHAGFGREQQEQRLMLMSHGLRGGWVATWRSGDDAAPAGTAPSLTAQALVVELGDAADGDAVLGVMGTPTTVLPRTPAALAYVLPSTGSDAPTTAVAWFSVGRRLASAVCIGADDVVLDALDDLVAATAERLSELDS